MTTVTVTNTEQRPDGSPKPFGRVTVGIVGVGWNGDGSLITDKARELTDGNGLASFDLAPSPAGTWYVWNHSDGITQSTFIVPSSGGPYTLQELLVTQPSGAADLAVTQDALTAALGNYMTVDPSASFTYETAPDGTKRIKTELLTNGKTMTYVYDDAHGGRISSQSDGTTTWTFTYDGSGLLTGIA